MSLPRFVAAGAVVLAACHGGTVAHPASPAVSMSASQSASASPAASPPGSSPSAAPPSAAPPSDPFALARSTRFTGPEALADALAQAETAIRSGTVSEAALAAAGRTQDTAYRQLVARPEWRAAVLARLPAALRPVAEANVSAGEELEALANPRDQIPNWRILTPRPQAELVADYQESQRLSGAPWEYLAAINLVETRMGRIQGLSSGGARGPMQFIPATWAYYGRGDIDNPHDAILAAGRFLAAHGAPSDMGRALYAYNPSQHYVHAISLYAQQIRADPRALGGYYHWQVYFRTLTKGEALLVEGYGS